MYATWTSVDGLVAVELDAEGVWLRRREHPADVWDTPEQLLRAGGAAGVILHDRGEQVEVRDVDSK